MDRTNTYLQCLAGKEKGKVFELNGRQVSLGRGEDNDIPLPSDAVSRTHAILSRDRGGWRIRDNRSKNGISVNGTRIEERLLESGDLVQVGDFVFRFVDPKPARRPGAVDLSAAPSQGNAGPGARGPSPLWLMGAIAGALAYTFVPRSPVTEKKPSPSVREVTSRLPPPVPAPEPVKALPPQPSPAAVAEAPPRVQPEANPVAEPPVRPITREDLAIKKKGRKGDPQKDLEIYLNEGKHYLSQGDWESALIAFNFAILIDPRNEVAIKGMEAADRKVRDVNSLMVSSREEGPGRSTPVRSPNADFNLQEERRRRVAELFVAANAALSQKKYQKAINNAEEIRRIEIKGETRYLNEAKQIIDRAGMKQKEEFDPFINQANAMLAEGAVRAARELCDQMLQRDEDYTPARDCLSRADEQLKREARNDRGKGGDGR